MNGKTQFAFDNWERAKDFVSMAVKNLKAANEFERETFTHFWDLRLPELKSMPYDDYLKTPEWQAQRRKALLLAGHQCQVCEAKGIELHVHHKTYERRGEERSEDLIVLCKDCHGSVHLHYPRAVDEYREWVTKETA